MLSRIAENLFWIGRYVERAEDTCRLLDVHIQQLVEDPTVDVAASAAGLLQVLGAPPLVEDAQPVEQQVLEALLYSPKPGSSAVYSLGAARYSARGVRETLSVEMWEGINTTYLDVSSTSFRRHRPALALRMVREHCATISGIADQTMSHDEGWHFLRLGRALERVDMTARMLTAAMTSGSTRVWSDALRACGAQHAYIRLHGGQRADVAASEFLLQDRLFPRSVVHCLVAAEETLASLEPAASARGTSLSEPLRLTGQARARLEYVTAEELIADLPHQLELLEATAREISGAINARYFEVTALEAWQRGSL